MVKCAWESRWSTAEGWWPFALEGFEVVGSSVAAEEEALVTGLDFLARQDVLASSAVLAFVTLSHLDETSSVKGLSFGSAHIVAPGTGATLAVGGNLAMDGLNTYHHRLPNSRLAANFPLDPENDCASDLAGSGLGLYSRRGWPILLRIAC